VIARLIFDCLEQREDLAFAEDPLGEFLLECWPADRGAGPRRIRFYRCGHVSKPQGAASDLLDLDARCAFASKYIAKGDVGLCVWGGKHTVGAAKTYCIKRPKRIRDGRIPSRWTATPPHTGRTRRKGGHLDSAGYCWLFTTSFCSSVHYDSAPVLRRVIG